MYVHLDISFLLGTMARQLQCQILLLFGFWQVQLRLFSTRPLQLQQELYEYLIRHHSLAFQWQSNLKRHYLRQCVKCIFPYHHLQGYYRTCVRDCQVKERTYTKICKFLSFIQLKLFLLVHCHFFVQQ